MSGKDTAGENRTESDKILDRVAQDSESVGASSMKRVSDHFSAKDANEEKWAEVWGTRIGRSLGLIAVAVLLFHLLQTYVF